MHDGRAMAVADKVKGESCLVLMKLGGRVLVATPLRRPDGPRDIFVVNPKGRPRFHIVTDIFGSSRYVFAILTVTTGPAFCTAYKIPGPDDWKGPLQFACSCGLAHVSKDIVEKCFKDISPTMKPPSTKAKQLKVIFEHFGKAWGLSDEEQEAIVKSCVKSSVESKRKPREPKESDKADDGGLSIAELVAACNDEAEEAFSGDSKT